MPGGFMYVYGFVFLVLLIFVCVKGRIREGIMAKNIRLLENELAVSNFIVSRKIGKFSRLWGGQYILLYLDDVNRKWLITSPLVPEVGKIRDYRDLLDYSFFDEDGLDAKGKMVRATVKATITGSAVILGAVTGGVFLGGWGAVVGGLGGAQVRVKNIPYHSAGTSKGYGLAIRTTDCDAQNTVLVFDFLNIMYKPDENTRVTKMMQKAVVTEGLARNSRVYKKNFAAIQEMVMAFNFIMMENANN